MRVLADLHQRAEARPDRNKFCSGKAFLAFCEYWLGYAKKSGDLNALDLVAAVMVSVQIQPSQSSTAPKDEPAQALHTLELTQVDVQSDHPTKAPASLSEKAHPMTLAQACVPIIQATAVYEDLEAFAGTDEDLQARIDAVSTAMASLRASFAKGKTSINEEDVHVEMKMRKALERLRRVLVKYVGTPLIASRARIAKSLLVDLVLTLELCLNERATSDDYTSLLDTLFVLARTTLSPLDPVSTDAAYLFLTRATTVIGLEVDSSHDYTSAVRKPACVTLEVHANFIRCISGAFHNLAGVLYQAERFGYAIRFLRHGCVLGGLALVLAGEGGFLEVDGEMKEKQTEVWRQLREQMTRRWELLGVCYSRIADRKLAYDAFVRSICTYTFSDALIDAIRTVGPVDVFRVFTGIKQLGAVIDRVTYMAACELTREPEAVSLKYIGDNIVISRKEHRACAVGLIVERQLQSLEGSLWKENAQRAGASLLRDALGLYDVETRPVRRAATLLQCLEFLYYIDKAGVDLLATLSLDWDQLLSELDTALNAQDLGYDTELARFLPFYKATAHLWLALHAHRHQEPRQSEIAASHIQEVCRVLRPIITPSTAPSPVAKKSPLAVKSSRKGAARAPTSAMKRPVRKAPPRTPRKPSEKQHPRSRLPTSPTPATQLDGGRYYNFDSLFNLLRMGIDLMGFFAHVILKVQLLHFTRRLSEMCLENAQDEYMISSINLAYEYLKLGKLKKAGSIFNKTLTRFKTGVVSKETRLLFLLRHAEALAVLGYVEQSSTSYAEAAVLAKEFVDESKEGSSTKRTRARIEKIERAALASHAFSEVQIVKNNPAVALEAMLQSLRLWNRALTSIERFDVPASAPTESNPFNTPGNESAGPEKPDGLIATRLRQPRAAFKGLEWRIALGLLETLLSLSELYFSRGSPREAEYFAEQAAELAGSINGPAMLGCALARKGEIQLRMGQLQEAYKTLVKAADALGNREGPDLADVHRLYADLHTRDMKDEDAQKLCSEATAMLEDLGRRLSAVDGPGLRRSSMGLQSSIYANASDLLAPELLSSLLRRHIWLLRHELGDEYQVLLTKLSSLPKSTNMQAEEQLLLAKLTLHDAYEHFREDIFLSSVTESVITLPMSILGEKGSGSASTQDVARLLNDADSLFWANLDAIARRGKAYQVRETAIYIASVRSLQTSVSKEGGDIALLVANLLDASAAITLHREMLEVVQNKFPEIATGDDLDWPSLRDDAKITRSMCTIRRQHAPSPSPFTVDDDSGDEAADLPSLMHYWNTVRDKYMAKSLSVTELSKSRVNSLPKHWTVIHISVTDDKNTMFVSRQRASQKPLVFCLPLKGRRESEEDEHLTFQDALDELTEIVRLNDETTRQAVHVRKQDKDARAAWWADRMALDKRLQELLENIEFCWLGAFKTILSEPAEVSSDVISDLRNSLERVFRHSLVSQDKKQKTRVCIDDPLLQCFSMLSPKCRDEELEDLVYFILDLYQFHGVSVAIAEVDVDQVVVDLRTALEEHSAKSRGRVRPLEDNHTFLVLDKNVQGIPWESIPTLRGRSISRIPSLDFLLDRLDMVRWQRHDPHENLVDRVDVDAGNAFFVLNPSGDLTATEKRFSRWLEKMKTVGWEGITGQAPSEQQVVDALCRKHLFIYFGHGGAEQFVRSHKVRHLPRCAMTMLWGCSSGLLKGMGDFDRVGTPFNYMLGGCPSLIANLWDVTDRDIDKLSQAVFDELALTPEHVKSARSSDHRRSQTSVVTALARSREVCKLKYLTGASPVIYGIPFYL
ncbi:peptidase family C50-domain-containing protein [Vararia minispora EC-137]|uniref:Peptidase family C50-domain-containing protein n=1 Tax=Vararia minispora EC-137 TaxID=1314806 RepID=A0ACB8QC09_9AGAM|nr:peptidase family C50-domain-containing protein [Vararia minispora EC-137]